MAEYKRFAHRTLGPAVRRFGHPERLRLPLQRAHIDERGDVYLSHAYLTLALVAVAMTALTTAVTILLPRVLGIALPVPAALMIAASPLVTAILGHFTVQFTPRLMADTRSRDIERHLPSAINYMSIMAGAGFTVEAIFSGLARQRIYGEISREAAWVTRDMTILGKDVVSALTAAIDRSPSRKLQDFLQGAVTTITSGGQLKNYFVAKSEQFGQDNRQEQRRFLESLGVLAESYVTVVVAGPVFMIVLLSVMLMFGGSGQSTLALGYIMILVMIPLAQAAFATTLKLIMPEG